MARGKLTCFLELYDNFAYNFGRHRQNNSQNNQGFLILKSQNEHYELPHLQCSQSSLTDKQSPLHIPFLILNNN